MSNALSGAQRRESDTRVRRASDNRQCTAPEHRGA
jgi:hypothetical protein